MGTMSILTGADEAKFYKDSYQKQLDSLVYEVSGETAQLKRNLTAFHQAGNDSEGLKKIIEHHEKERSNLYNTLGQLLDKENTHEWNMWKETSGLYKTIMKPNSRSVNVKQKNIKSDPDITVYSNNINRYLDKHAEYQTKESFRNFRGKIEKKELELREAKEEQTRAIQESNLVLSEFRMAVKNIKIKIAQYYKILEQGEKVLEKYKNSFWAKLWGAEKRDRLLSLKPKRNIIEESQGVLDSIDEELSEYPIEKAVKRSYD